MLLIFLDTETTGLDPSKHRALEIAFKVVDSNQVVVSYETLIAQSDEVFAAADPESLKIHGITRQIALKGKSEATVAAEIVNDLNHAGIREKGGVFICQNPSFDRAFFIQLISVEEQKAMRWPYHWLDLASMYFALHPTVTREKELSKNQIARALGLPPEKEPHRAMNGVNHLVECFEALFAPV